jgi:hypothetical protein
MSFCKIVKPTNNDHSWDLKKGPFEKRALIKVSFRLVVDESNQPLLTGGCFSELVVKACLTVSTKIF